MYETLHFTAKASVRKTTQGTSQDLGLVKTLGTILGLPRPGLVADPGPSSCNGPRLGTGRLPPPTEAQEADTRGTRGPEAGRRGPPGRDLAEAVVQHLRGLSPGRWGCDRALSPAPPIAELPEPREPPCSPVPTADVYRPHLTVPEPCKQDGA